MYTSDAFFKKTVNSCCAAVMMLLFGSSPAFAQTMIVYHSFHSGVSYSAGNSSVITSMTGGSVFGISGESGTSVFSGYHSFGHGLLSSVSPSLVKTPVEFALYQNYPNPFNPSTTIDYQLAAGGHVSLKVYDAIGREVAELEDGEKVAGRYSATFTAGSFATGIYFARLISGENTQLKKMVLLK